MIIRSNRLVLLALLLLAVLAAPQPTFASDKGFPLEGDWKGTLVTDQGEIPVIFHIIKNSDDTFTATLDSPDQEAFGIPIDSVEFEEHTVRMWSAAVQGGFTAELAEDKPDEIVGTWEQMGNTLPLTLTRVVEES